MNPERSTTASLTAWMARWVPPALTTSRTERLRAVLGAWLGLLLTALLSFWLAPATTVWLVAPIGASAVLVFTAPASPLAQPWSVVVGNTLSAVVGLGCAAWLPDPVLAASVAVALAIAVMMAGRCLHPPGGAVALLVVLTHEQHGWFVLFPVLTNSVLLVLIAMLYNNLSRHPYPHRASSAPGASASGQIERADLDAALANYGQVLDVAPDELVHLLRRAQGAAAERLWSTLMCRDIMTPDPVVVDFRWSLAEALDHMKRLSIKALPVVDQARHVTGIITQTDLLRSAQGGAASLHRQSVGDVMTRQVRVASADSHALDLLPLFSSAGHHHLPVIDADKRLVGILTQTDLVRALSNVMQRPESGHSRVGAV
jgi:CBS domain-containing membrane protein